MRSRFVVLLMMTQVALCQSFETSPFLQVHGSLIAPTGDASNVYSLGAGLSVAAGVPVEGVATLSLRLAFLFPSSERSNVSTTLYGLSGHVTLPFAPEAASTAYVTGGLGLYRAQTKNTFLGAVPSQTDLGIEAGLGYLIAPEQWKSIYLDLQAAFRRIFQKSPAWQDLSITFGVGFHLM